MKSILLGAILLVAVFAAPLFGLGPIQDVRPNPAMVFLVAIAMRTIPSGGAALGFVMGILEAAMAGGSPGAFMVSRTVIGFAMAYLRLLVLGESVWMTVVATFGATLGSDAVFFAMSPRTTAASWIARTLLGAGVNAVLAVPVYYVVRWALRKPRFQFPGE